MKANDLYKLEPIKIRDDVYCMETLLDQIGNLDTGYLPDTIEGLELKYYADHVEDSDRIWHMFSGWFKNRPFAIFQQAGRGGKDYDEFHITDYPVLNELIAELRKLGPETTPEELDADKDYDFLGDFYNGKLSDFYDADLTPKYKIGDIVLAKVEKGYGHNSPLIETRCKVEQINNFNPHETYIMTQLDRKSVRREQVYTIVTDKNNGDMWARGNDSTIVKLLEESSTNE